jgi:hypothetical protein
MAAAAALSCGCGCGEGGSRESLMLLWWSPAPGEASVLLPDEIGDDGAAKHRAPCCTRNRRRGKNQVNNEEGDRVFIADRSFIMERAGGKKKKLLKFATKQNKNFKSSVQSSNFWILTFGIH